MTFCYILRYTALTFAFVYLVLMCLFIYNSVRNPDWFQTMWRNTDIRILPRRDRIAVRVAFTILVVYLPIFMALQICKYLHL